MASGFDSIVPLAATPTSLPIVRSVVSLFDVEPDLARWVPLNERAAAERATRVPEVLLEPGRFDPRTVFNRGREGFGALIVSGLVVREISMGGRPTVRLLGPGDVFTEEAPDADSLQTGVWSVSLPTRLAVLDDHLLLAVRRWPRLVRGLCLRLQQCHDSALLQLSVSHRPAVEDRIVGLFEVLAMRWGKMTREGIVVPIPLTHDAIGQMIGARRPTVTLGLRALAQQGRLYRQNRSRWLLGADFGSSQSAPRLRPTLAVPA